jgi:hypothetical protein
MILFGCTNHGYEIFYEQIVQEKQKQGFIRARKLWNTNRVYDYENHVLKQETEKRPVGVILNERLNYYNSNDRLLTFANAGFFTLENIPILAECWKDKEIVQIYRKDLASAIIEEYVQRHIKDYENTIPNFSIPTNFIINMVSELVKFKTLDNLIVNKKIIYYEDVIYSPKKLNDLLGYETNFQYWFNKPINFIVNPNLKCINYFEVVNLTKNI